MKRIIFLLLTAALLLTALTGCAALKRRKPAASEGAGADALTVRIVNRSAEELAALAASCRADGKTLGSKSCDETGEKPVLKQGGAVEFSFLASELPGGLSLFELDVFAAERSGEDYSACGGVAIRDPKPGETYTLALDGDFVSGLYLTAADPEHDLTVSAPAKCDVSAPGANIFKTEEKQQ